MNDILKCEGLVKAYGPNTALKELTAGFAKGKIIGLLGPNGSGKTTLIKLAAGLLTPTSGSISIAGMNVGTETKSMVSYLPEKTYLPGWMTVMGCVDLFRSFYDDFDKARALDMLKSLSVPTDAPLKTLSKGTQEKVQLVLVMARRARLYLLDEPIGGVDPAARDYILGTIISNYDGESTIIISTHLIRDVEKILDEFVFIHDGRIILRDTSDNVRTQKGMSIDELFREVFRC